MLLPTEDLDLNAGSPKDCCTVLGPFIMRHIIPRIRIFTRALKKPPVTTYRAMHTASAKFITISPQGTPATREIEVYLGDPGGAYVIFDIEIGQAFKRDSILQGGCSLGHDEELYPLKFHHDTRHFSHGTFTSLVNILELEL
jgi:hypothetical protein